MTKQLPRGQRNNNPGNIDYVPTQRWQGLADPPLEPAPGDGSRRRFAVFTAPKWGIRAIARNLITYYDLRKAGDGSRIDTIAEAIDRWAPSIENHTSSYIRAVDAEHPASAWDVLNFHEYADLMPLVRAIIHHELGVQPYSQEEIDEGLKLAGVVKKQGKVPTAETVGVASGAVATTTLAAYSEIKDTARTLREQGQTEQSSTLLLASGGLSIIAVLVLACAGYFMWKKARARKDDR